MLQTLHESFVRIFHVAGELLQDFACHMNLFVWDFHEWRLIFSSSSERLPECMNATCKFSLQGQLGWTTDVNPRNWNLQKLSKSHRSSRTLEYMHPCSNSGNRKHLQFWVKHIFTKHVNYCSFWKTTESTSQLLLFSLKRIQNSSQKNVRGKPNVYKSTYKSWSQSWTCRISKT